MANETVTLKLVTSYEAIIRMEAYIKKNPCIFAKEFDERFLLYIPDFFKKREKIHRFSELESFKVEAYLLYSALKYWFSKEYFRWPKCLKEVYSHILQNKPIKDIESLNPLLTTAYCLDVFHSISIEEIQLKSKDDFNLKSFLRDNQMDSFRINYVQEGQKIWQHSKKANETMVNYYLTYGDFIIRHFRARSGTTLGLRNKK